METLDQWMDFIAERWFVILIAVVVLFLVIKIVKTLLKWVVVIVIVAALFMYGSNYTDTIKDVSGMIIDHTKEEVLELLSDEIEDADYEESPDGSFKITSKNFIVVGHIDSDEVEVTFRGQTITLKKRDFIERYIEEVKQQKYS